MDYNNNARINMDVTLASTEANTPSSFMTSDERTALKRAKKAEYTFRKLKGYDIDTFWIRCFKSFFRKKKK